MRYRKLGRSALEVSEISLGSWLTYGYGVEAQAARRCVDAAFDAGINFFDTANVYGRGAAEEFLGKALASRPRGSYILATKLYFPMSSEDSGLSRAQVLKQVDLSLKRLNTDYVDLYQCHRYDDDTPLEETMRALSDVVKAGKARYIGFSEWEPGQIEASARIPDCERFVSSQPQYSLLWREPEAGVFPVCKSLGVGQIVWSPLGQGVLTGKYRAGQPIPAESRAASARMGGFMGRLLTPRVLDGVERLRGLAAELGLTLPQLALAWVLRREEVSSAIIGASRPEQVVENAGASGVVLPDETLTAMDAIFPA